MDLKNIQQYSSTKYSPATKPNHKTIKAGRKISKETRRNKSRIWVGSFPHAETAALRGENAPLNFRSSSHHQGNIIPPIPPHELQINLQEPNKDDFEICDHDHVEMITRGDVDVDGGEESDVFVDEEAMFNMPVLLDSMAEGMLLTPLAMKKGFNWDQYDHLLLDFNLWT